MVDNFVLEEVSSTKLVGLFSFIDNKFAWTEHVKCILLKIFTYFEILQSIAPLKLKTSSLLRPHTWLSNIWHDSLGKVCRERF